MKFCQHRVQWSLSKSEEVFISKKIVSKEELVTLLNNELSKHDECKDCHFLSIMMLKEEDSEGCNWSFPHIRCSGVPADICKSIAEKIVYELRGKYNVGE